MKSRQRRQEESQGSDEDHREYSSGYISVESSLIKLNKCVIIMLLVSGLMAVTLPVPCADAFSAVKYHDGDALARQYYNFRELPPSKHGFQRGEPWKDFDGHDGGLDNRKEANRRNRGEKEPGDSRRKRSTAVSHPVVPGSVMHLFPRYGYLSLSMRVVPRNDSQNWIFLEPSKKIFHLPRTGRVQEQSFVGQDNTLPLHNEFHIDLCEDLEQLIQAYFRRFVIEGSDKPWHAFAGGWRTPSIAKYFGIDPNYVKGDFKYMLVRVLMVRKAGRFTPFQNISVLPDYDDDLNAFRVKDYTSTFQFFNTVGTHYVNSYLTGNSIFQVFVYDDKGYETVKRRLSESGWIRSSYMSQLPYLLPLWTKHMGKVMVLNSKAETIRQIRNVLTVRFLFSEYPNIFKMHDNAELVKTIENYLKFEPDGLLGLDLKTLKILFRSDQQRHWFDESLQQTLHLWETNLR